MVREIVKYPSPLSVEFGVDVRVFDEKLFALIDDLKDTMNENNLDALSAYQIGEYFNLILIRDGDTFLELINPRLITHSGRVVTEEKTAYYGDLSANVERYEKISIVYQDRDGNNKTLQADGSLAVVIQRKLDYTFGATFLGKLSESEREKFEAKLQYGADVGTADYCPTTFFRDKILKAINISMLLMVFALIGSFFVSEADVLESMWHYQLYASFFVLALNIFYFFYAQYEGKIYTSCTSCQIGNIVGTFAISITKLTLLMVASYFIINP